ncbi:MAG: hypothetical protein KI790_16800, partial [Cyclobacteriaceae bacterium]|nr:hypothetical protein [Cyclobacteriaceae bacterium HetDA_MAG_MS6]
GHHTWGNYGGTFEKPENGIILAPRAGFFMSWWEESLILKCGYEYLDTKSEIPKHRVTISLMMVLGNATY